MTNQSNSNNCQVFQESLLKNLAKYHENSKAKVYGVTSMPILMQKAFQDSSQKSAQSSVFFTPVKLYFLCNVLPNTILQLQFSCCKYFPYFCIIKNINLALQFLIFCDSFQLTSPFTRLLEYLFLDTIIKTLSFEGLIQILVK